jgi:septal ring-binding cell division protein DamX
MARAARNVRKRQDPPAVTGRLGGLAAASVVFAAALFALGLEIGRRRDDHAAAPPRLQDRLALLDDAERIAPPTPAPAKLVFHDALTQERPPDTLPAMPPQPVPAKPAKKPKDARHASATPAPQPGAASARRATPATPPAAPRPSTGVWSDRTPLPVHGRWTVHVGASPREAEAQRLAARTPGARVVVADVDGKRWYRVRVGGFATRSEAETELERLARVAGAKGFVTSGP